VNVTSSGVAHGHGWMDGVVGSSWCGVSMGFASLQLNRSVVFK
jgi:hypothetical protein